jgi:hypothetical protein
MLNCIVSPISHQGGPHAELPSANLGNGSKQAASDPIADVRRLVQTVLMSKLYPALRIAQGWLVLGTIGGVVALAMLVAHFGFGVVIYDKDTGLPATSASITFGAFFIGGVSAVFASAGALLLRARRRFYDR